MSLLIKNGTIVTASDIYNGDIYIEKGKIIEIGLEVSKEADEIVDVKGKYVIPGGVDVHTHFNLDVGIAIANDDFYTGTLAAACGGTTTIVDHMGFGPKGCNLKHQTHFNLDVGIAIANDDFYTGTLAAACGGTTTIVDHMGFGPKGCNLKHQVDIYHKYAEDNAVIDYSFHGVIQHINQDILEEMKSIVEDEGISSFKAYLTYDYKIDDEDMVKIFKRLRELGGITTVHCENHGSIKYLKDKYVKEGLKSSIYHYLSRPEESDKRLRELGGITTVHCENHGSIKYLKDKYVKEGLKSSIYHYLSRPEESEGEAVNRMINIAKISGNSPLYIVHLSTKLGLDYIKMARERGQKIYAETCPQYLILDKEKYELDNNEGLKYIMSPPLRERHNCNELWKGINEGYIQTVATDHCPFSFSKDKQLGKDDFTKCPNGAPGVEERIPLIFSEGVMKGNISINKFVEVCSTNPAKIFGLYPKKGTIQVGSDGDLVVIDPNKEMKGNISINKFVEVCSTNPAKIFGLYPKKGTIQVGSDGDLVVIDPNKEVILTKDKLHSNVDYTAYEGIKVKGYPIITISNGEIIYNEGKFKGKKGRGRFIKRNRANLI